MINNNIALQKFEQRGLTDALAKGDDLETTLYLSRVVYEMEKLDMPRTVCSHQECVEYKDGRKHYKSELICRAFLQTMSLTASQGLCHDPCYLKDVQVDQFPCEALMSCGAFCLNGIDSCSTCDHSWQLHLHVLWQPVEKVVQVPDEAVLQHIKENKSGVEVMQEAIKSRQELIKKYESEKDIIQKAAGQFAVFLKQSSIKPWNDSKLAYLAHLIDEVSEADIYNDTSSEKLSTNDLSRRRAKSKPAVLSNDSKISWLIVNSTWKRSKPLPSTPKWATAARSWIRRASKP